MRRRAPLSLLSLLFASGCKRLVDNKFTIADPEGSVTSAVVQLCGSQVKLSRSKGGFSGYKKVNCDGDGKIVVLLSGGRETSCPIGYVAPGAKQEFPFIVQGGRCVVDLAALGH